MSTSPIGARCSCGRPRADKSDLARWRAGERGDWERALCWMRSEGACNGAPTLASVRCAVETIAETLRSMSTDSDPGSDPDSDPSLGLVTEGIAKLQIVDQIWRQIDELRDLAEVRSRILLGQVGGQIFPDPPGEPEEPNWLYDAATSARYELEAGFPAVQRACRLVAACLARLPVEVRDHLRADLEDGPYGSVSVNWRIEGREHDHLACLNWVVRGGPLRWPGIDVSCHLRLGLWGDPRLEIEGATIRLASHALQTLERFVAAATAE